MYQDTSKKIHIKTTYIFTDSEYYYILEEISCRDIIEFEIDVEVFSDDEENQYECFKLLLYVLSYMYI